MFMNATDQAVAAVIPVVRVAKLPIVALSASEVFTRSSSSCT
jgi:hypothetical protein